MQEQTFEQLQAKLAAAEAQIQQLQQANEEAWARIREQSATISRAKDITPYSRPSFLRVLTLARAACLDLARCRGGGWLLSFGSMTRKFKSLFQIWDILCLESWSLCDLFGDFLVVKAPKLRAAKKLQLLATSVRLWKDYKITLYDSTPPNLTAAQNSFETWNSVLDDYVPFSSSA
jgi:hypothetical protein